jgi:hypothetical protein
MKFSDARIELLDECSSSETRYARERYYVELYGDLAVNKNIPSRTSKEYYNENREEILKKQNKYNNDNRDKINAGFKKYREANSEKISAKNKKYREANKEKINAKRRENYQKNREALISKAIEYYQKNKEVIKFKARFQNTEFGKLCTLAHNILKK